MSNGIYTFYPEFSQFVTLYRGVTAVWIGNGDSEDPANPDFPSFNNQGVLYASYIDDSVQNLGPVSSYAEAVASGKAGPGTDFPTEAAWILHIATVSQHAADALDASEDAEESALQAESWAVGTRDGDPDTEREGASTNNAKYWSDTAEGWAVGNEENNAQYYAGLAGDSATSAIASADEAKQWANWNIEGDPSATNNAKSYSEVSGEQRRQSESWAVGTRDGETDTQRSGAATNNSKYWSDQSKSWATTKENDNAKYYAETAGQHAINAGESEQNAKKWANWNTEGEPSATNNAKYYCDSSTANVQNAEAWANGTRNGFPISTGDPAEDKYARYWAIHASGSASDASDSALAASGSAIKAEQWATGGTSGTPTATNNAKYWALQAEDKADSVRNPSILIEYANSDRGSVVPSSGWDIVRDPVKGYYLWARMTVTWGDGTKSYLYNVAYEGLDGTGAVLSVNGETGYVVLDASMINIDKDAETPQTIVQALNTKLNASDYISDAQIDQLFAVG